MLSKVKTLTLFRLNCVKGQAMFSLFKSRRPAKRSKAYTRFIFPVPTLLRGIISLLLSIASLVLIYLCGNVLRLPLSVWSLILSLLVLLLLTLMPSEKLLLFYSAFILCFNACLFIYRGTVVSVVSLVSVTLSLTVSLDLGGLMTARFFWMRSPTLLSDLYIENLESWSPFLSCSLKVISFIKSFADKCDCS